MRSNVGRSDTVANPVTTIPVQDLTLNTKEKMKWTKVFTDLLPLQGITN